jgi:ribosome-associated protein
MTSFDSSDFRRSNAHEFEIADDVTISGAEIRFQTARSGGPGGQNVNKLNTKVELWLPVTAINGLDPAAMARLRALAGKRINKEGFLHLTAQTERTQERNRAAVLDRLRMLVDQAKIAPKPRKRTKPTKAAKRRRMDAKRRRGETKAARRPGTDW